MEQVSRNIRTERVRTTLLAGLSVIFLHTVQMPALPMPALPNGSNSFAAAVSGGKIYIAQLRR